MWPSYSLSKLANVLFTQELEHCASEARLDCLTATTLHPGVIDADLWRYAVGEERLAKMKDGRGLGSLVLGATIRNSTMSLTTLVLCFFIPQICFWGHKYVFHLGKVFYHLVEVIFNLFAPMFLTFCPNLSNFRTSSHVPQEMSL